MNASLAISPAHPAGHHGARTFLVVSLAALVLIIALTIILPLQQPIPQIDAELPEYALEKHGNDAQLAKQCLKTGEGYLFWNPQSHRFGIVCWLGDRWGIVILTSAWVVITAFVTKCARAREYMKRQGYRDLFEDK